jgi:uncharacterized protein (TIGR04255 family)
MTDASAPNTTRIEFENPPITELAVSLFHVPLAELKAQHIGIYWTRVRDRYPICQQQTVVVPSESQASPLLRPVAEETFPLPRFWFYSNDQPTLVQVQRDAFMFNWRRSPTSATTYPHYESVIKDFWREFENYHSFIREITDGKSLDPIKRCELNYINLITPNEMFANQGQLVNVLPPVAGFYDIQTHDRHLVGLNATVSYQVGPTLHIDLAIRSGRRADTGEPAAVLDIKAHGVPADLSLYAAHLWYDSAHDATYKLFLEATAKQVQETIWKPR